MRVQNTELSYTRTEIIGICLFLQSVLANIQCLQDNSNIFDYHDNNDDDYDNDIDGNDDKSEINGRSMMSQRDRERERERERLMKTVIMLMITQSQKT